MADRVTIDADWHWSREKSRHWRLYYHNRAGASLKLRGRDYPLRAREIYVLPIGQRLEASCVGEVEQFFIQFQVVGLPDLALRTLFREPVCLSHDATLKRGIVELGRQLQGASTAQTTAPNFIKLDIRERHTINVALQWRLKSVVYQALANCVADATPAQMEQCWQVAQPVSSLVPALHHIEEHLGEPLNNASLAQLCGFNEHYFIRAFGAAVGQTPAHYIRECRVNEAAQRLRFSARTIEEIARDLGFCDRTHFSRVFKNIIGVSPAIYRNRGAE